MLPQMIRLSRRVFLAAPALLGAASARRQGVLPARGVRIIIGYPVGGGTDEMARVIAAALQQRIADRRLTTKSFPFDPQTDLMPLTLAGTYPTGCGVAQDRRSLADYGKWLQTRPSARFGTTSLQSFTIFGLIGRARPALERLLQGRLAMIPTSSRIPAAPAASRRCCSIIAARGCASWSARAISAARSPRHSHRRRARLSGPGTAELVRLLRAAGLSPKWRRPGSASCAPRSIRATRPSS